jgi:hypothetical protein
MANCLKDVFKTDRPLIGMIHFPPLIRHAEYPGISYISDKMLREAEMLERGGVDAIMIENNYDIPHHEKIEAMKAAMLGSLAQLLRSATKLPLGIDVLWNDYESALSICESAGLSFFRVAAFVDTVKTAYGIMGAKSNDVVKLRHDLGRDDLFIMADIQVKHSEMVDKNKRLEQSALEAMAAGADALIITGKWTGDAPQTADVEEARKVAGKFPILIGSGATSDNLPTLLDYADGIIVGTALKEGTSLDKEKEINLKPYRAELSLVKIKEFSEAFRKFSKR